MAVVTAGILAVVPPRRSSSVSSVFSSSGRAFGILYIGGAIVGIIAVFLPHGSGFSDVADVTIAAVASAIGIWAWHRRQLRLWPTHILLGIGTVMVSAGVYSGRGDDISMSAAVIYILLALGAGLFTTPAGTAAQVALIAGAYGVVLILSGNRGAAGEWMFITGAAAVTAWVTTRSRSELVELSRIDPLTGLANRAGLQAILDRELSQAARSRHPLSVAVVDLDDFKTVNDRRGHLAGDDALVRTVRAWQDRLRSGDLLARFGGDEFVLVLPNATAWQGTRVLQRLRRIETACEWCAGLATWDRTEFADSLLHRADEALYGAKSRRGRYSIALARSGASPRDLWPGQHPKAARAILTSPAVTSGPHPPDKSGTDALT